MDLGELARRVRGPFWTLVWIRAVFWVGAALALVWAPFRNGPFQAFPRVWGSGRLDLLFGAFYQWDATWFKQIALHGYGGPPLGRPAGTAAFFPLYPLVVRGVGEVVRSLDVAGVLVSLVAGGLAAWVLRELARPYVGEAGARFTVLLVALYPVGYVFTALYSDALFLLLAAGSFLAAQRRRPWLAGVLGGLAVGTRALGLALVPALVVLLWPRGERRPAAYLRLAPILLLPAALGAYALYLHVHLGDALAFAHAQRDVWLRRSNAAGPFLGLWEASRDAWRGLVNLALHVPRRNAGGEGLPQATAIGFWNLVHLLLLAAAAWLTAVAWRRLGAAFGLYSAATLLVVLWTPVQGLPLTSLPRLLLADFPLFVALAVLCRGRPGARTALLCTFAAFGALAAVAFSRHVWVA